MVVVKTKKWLSREEFEELLKISDYLGYDQEYKRFSINVEKAFRNGYSLEDIKELIKDLSLEVEGSLESLKTFFEALTPRLEWDSAKGLIKIHVPKGAYFKLRNILSSLGAYKSAETPEALVFNLYPHRLKLLVEQSQRAGISFEDPYKLTSEKPLPFKPELKNIELRDYQKEALEKWLSNNGQGIIALPTGAGKTIIAIAALVSKPVKTLIIVYTKEQMFQWKDFIIRTTNLPSSMVGLVYSESKQLAPVTVTTYQSGFRQINSISPFFDQLIVDEVHHLPAEKFRYIAIHSIARYRMGLSATPVREDGKHEELFPLLGGIIYYKTPEELVEKGYLARYVIKTIRVKMTPEEKKEYMQLRNQFQALAKGRKFEEIVEDASRGDPSAIEALRIHGRIKNLLAHSETKINKAIEIAMRELEKGSKIIIFTQFVDQAEKIAEKLGGFLLTGEIPASERKKALEAFKKADKGVLVVTTVGDEGLDIPDANVGILVSGTGSRRQFIQRLGRLLRPGKKEAVLYELVFEKTSEEYQAYKRKRLELDLEEEEDSS